MPPNAFIATLAQSLATSGAETEIYLSTIKTLTGETVTTSQFATLGKGVLTVDPLSSANIEFCSFTGVDATGLGFTGAIRGLSALSYSPVTANAKYHPVGTTVIIAFGVHNLLDLQTYITGLISGSLGTATDLTAGSTKITFGMGSAPRAKSAIVSQSASGATNLLVNPFSFENGSAVYGNLPSTANPPVLTAVTSGVFTAPTVNPRIDLVVWTTASAPGSVAIRQGSEASTPSVPTPTTGDIVLCSVFNRVGQTKVLERSDGSNGYIIQWYEPSLYTASTNLTTGQTAGAVDQSQTTQNSTLAVGESNVTTKKSLIAQSFVTMVTGMAGVRLYKSADTGTFTGTVKVALQIDSSGSPSGSDLASSIITNAAWLKLKTGEIGVLFSTEYDSLVVGGTYWIVVSPSTSDTSNHPNLGINTAGGYASGALKYNNSADGWVAIATSILYFKTLSGVVSRIMKTQADGTVPDLLKPYSLLASDFTTVNNSSTSETSAYSVNIPGGTFGPNSGIHAKIMGSMSATAGAQMTCRLKYNGSTLYAVSSSGSQVAGTPMMADIYIINQNSVSSQKGLGMAVFLTNIYQTTTGLSTYLFQDNAQTAAVDLSAPGLLEITIQISSTASSQACSYQGTIIEKIG